MTTTPDPKTVREIARDCVADYIDDARDIAAHVMGHFGMGVPGDVYAWTDAVRTDLRAVVPSWPDEQPQDGDVQAARAWLADLAEDIRSYHQSIPGQPGCTCGRSLACGNDVPDYAAIWTLEAALNAWAPAEDEQDEQCAWHELRRFSGPALLDEGDVDQHEITHPEQCSTLPPGAVCWAEHQPFRWWWPTAHGTYRIRPEDVQTGGSEDGPDWNVTLRVQVRGEDGGWFEYTNDYVGPDPANERPAIVERLKAAVADKAAQDERDGEIARLRKDLAEMTRCRDNAMAYAAREHVPIELDDEIDIDGEVLADRIEGELLGPGWDWEDDRTPGLLAKQAVAVIRPQLARLTDQAQKVRAVVAEAQAERDGDVRAVAIGERYTLGHGGAYCHCCHKPMREGTPVVRVTAAQCTDCAALEARDAKGGEQHG